ncbi:MAG: 5'/3'-nucleotidase SurE [Erysipelotrichaceae bacterium]|nr:5'/3'-nucleotidase SurE [Erysipelotrichaceae bacterium]
MRILIANDNGINAPGIRALIRILRPLGDITVTAPARQQTAKGHSCTLYEEIKVRPMTIEGDIPAYKIWGTPKDCVDIAIQCLMDEKPDLVVSGINEGPNMANDCVSSGTIGAATAGFLNDIPSIAFSLDFGEQYDYMKPAEEIREITCWFIRQPFNSECLISVNIPNTADPFKGIVVCENGGTHIYTQDYQVRTEGKYLYITSPSGTPVTKNVIEDLDHDLYAIRNNYITINPLDTDLIRNHLVPEVRKAWNER